MGYRKFLSFLISITLVIASFFSVSFADTTEGGPSGSTDIVTSSDAGTSVDRGDGTSYPLPEGLTVILPSEFDEVLWIGMDADDTELTRQAGVEPILQLYETQGVALQCDAPPVGVDDGQIIYIVIGIHDAPSKLSESTFIDDEYDDVDEEGDVEHIEILKKGVIHVGNKDVYKISSDGSIEINNAQGHFKYKNRANKYSIVSESGKLFDISLAILTDPSNLGETVPYTEEDLAHLEYLEDYIIGGLKIDGKTVSIDLPAFDIEEEAGTSYPLPEGVTVTLPSECNEVVWVGMDESDPMSDYIKAMYEDSGLALEGHAAAVGKDDGQFFSINIHIKEAPSDVSESTFISNVAENHAEDEYLENAEILRKGVIRSGDMDLYKTYTDLSVNFDAEGHKARYRIRSYKYSFVTESGKLIEIEASLLSDPSNPDDAIPFTDEDLKHLDQLESYVFRSLRYDGKTVSLEAEAYPVSEEGGSVSPETPEVKPGNTATKSAGKTFFKSFVGFSFPLWILLAGLVVLLISGAKASKRKEWQEEPLSLSTSKAIQGFAAIGIILHHLSQSLLQASGPFQFLSECGVLFVGIFFFFSGYGLYTSLKTKDDYLKGFLKKRLITILIPFYMCIAVFTVASCICGTKYKPLELLYVLSGWSLINSHMWYIVEIAILYLAFFIFYKLIKNRTAATCAMSLFVLLMMGGSLYLCHGKDMGCRYWFMGEWWYNASILFIVGILVSKYQDGLRKIARKAYVVLLPVFAILTGLFGWITSRFLDKYSYWSEIPGEDPRYLDKLRCLSVQIPFILCFVLFVLLVMMKVRFGNPVLKFLGSISLELYLIHNLFLTGLADGRIFKVSSPSMYILLTLLMSIGAATIISGTDKYLIGLISGKKKESSELNTPRNHAIDLMRIVMAFLVVTIHMPFSGSAGDVFITFGKTAVPFFLVVCGYMLYRDDSKELMSRLLKQTRRILIFFLASNVFYAAATALYDKKMTGKVDMSQYFTKKAIKDFLLYNFSPFSEHLWFFGSLLYALVILLILNKLKVLKPAIFAGPVLIAAYVILSHMGVGESYQLRNAILVGLAYTMTGMLIRRYEKKILSIKNLHILLPVLAIGAGVAAIIELCTYKKGIAVPFVGCEILTIVLVLLCLRFPNFGMGTYAEKLGRTCSLPIYIMHIFTMMVFVMTKNDAFFGKFGAVTVFAVTAVGVALYENIKEAVISSKD